jgi:hypothetical protein
MAGVPIRVTLLVHLLITTHAPLSEGIVFVVVDRVVPTRLQHVVQLVEIRLLPAG